MLQRLGLPAALLAIASCAPQSSRSTDTSDHQHSAMTNSPTTQADSSFAALQQRGKMAMGVDQYASVHHFVVEPDGGRIRLEMKAADSLGVLQIRAHLKLIKHAFEAGDFSTPEFVHMRSMPGTKVMTERKASIKYTYADLPAGGEVRISTADPLALAAIHEFMGAQSTDHRAH